LRSKTIGARAIAYYHAVIWIDHKQARIFHFDVEEADRTVIRDHVARDIHSRDKRTGDRVEENKPFFEDVAKAIADAAAILIVGPAQEKDFFAKFLSVKHPTVRAHVEGVEKADHPSDGELLEFARRYVKAADHMKPQIDPAQAGKP
jgi:stalled ribosome rescue protein Dom34